MLFRISAKLLEVSTVQSNASTVIGSGVLQTIRTNRDWGSHSAPSLSLHIIMTGNKGSELWEMPLALLEENKALRQSADCCRFLGSWATLETQDSPPHTSAHFTDCLLGRHMLTYFTEFLQYAWQCSYISRLRLWIAMWAWHYSVLFILKSVVHQSHIQKVTLMI